MEECRMKQLELGVFLPTGEHGFVYSSNAPAYRPTFRLNMGITTQAEALGLDYVFGMAKWRGFGGSTGLWDSSAESLTLMAALAAVTERIRLIGTVTPILFHPAYLAKVAATIDDISNGRLGLNIVTGALLGEYTQMGGLPERYDENRYAYATEWLQVLKRLWSEPRVTHHGQYFTLTDCVSEPKPKQKPHPTLVCAASSEEGMRFTVAEADYIFISDRTIEGAKAQAVKVKDIARKSGSVIKTTVLTMLLLDETDDAAEAYRRHLVAGADTQALTNMGTALMSQSRQAAKSRGAQRLADPEKIFFGLPVVGGPETVAARIAELATDADVDSVCLCFPDYARGLELFGRSVLPLLTKFVDAG
jgi:pyrimidine oxygenase